MGRVDATDGPFAAAFAIMALVGGLWLLGRGFGGYRTADRISGTATSTISALAVGEVRVSGVIEPAELTLVSLLQGVPCVAYRSCVDVDGESLGEGDVLEERSVGFRVRDPSGSLRIFPRGARIDAPVRWSDSTGTLGDEPPGLHWRTGSAFAVADPDRETAIAALLTVRDPGVPAALASLGGDRGHRDYRESRLEPGDEVTIVGVAMPFGELADPGGADVGGRDPSSAGADPEIAADLAHAQAAGILLDDPEAAWGNAAIPGFGIGRPTREPELDPAADALPIASAAEAAHAERTFAIAPDTLVVAATGDAPLLITYGTPAAAAERHGSRFLVGLLGAVVSIGAAVVLAMLATNGLGS
jgi:hypothetical protein